MGGKKMPDKPIPQGVMAAAEAIALSPIDIQWLINPQADDTPEALDACARTIAAHTVDPAELERVKKQRDKLVEALKKVGAMVGCTCGRSWPRAGNHDPTGCVTEIVKDAIAETEKEL